jgi:hypothetical protein
MRNVAEITAINGHPGLVAFDCASCGITHSVLRHPGDAVSDKARRMVNPKVANPPRKKLIRSTLRHDWRWGLTLTLADAGAASNAYRNESCDQSDE